MARKNKWKNMSPKIRTATREAMVDALEYLLDESNKLVPHDEGVLQSTGSYQIDSDGAKGVVFYNTPYAVRLHEHPEYKFQKGRQGKWLSTTFQIKGPRAYQYLADKINKALR